MGAGLFTTRAPEIGYAVSGVPPPGSLYIEPSEVLVVNSWSSTASGAITITVRLLRPDGQVITSQFAHTPNSDRTQATSWHDLSEGFLLSVLVDVVAAPYRRGHCWLMVGLQHGAAAVGVVHAALIAGYVTGTDRLAWPGGRPGSSVEGPGLIRSVAGADPAAGAEFSVTAPTGARWRLVGLIATLVTDATVANRVVSLLVDDGTTALYRAAAQTAQTASLTVVYSFGAALPSAPTAGGVSVNPLATDLLLAAGYRIRSLTTAIAAGDNWGAPQLLVEEWIEP